MNVVVPVVAVAIVLGGVYLGNAVFGGALGAGVVIGMGLVAYIGLKLYTDHQERLLRADFEQMTPEQRRRFLEAAKDEGFLRGDGDT